MQLFIRLFLIFIMAAATTLAIKFDSALYAGGAVFIFGCLLSILTDNIREAIYKTH